MRYVLDFGSGNAGGAPAFSLFSDLDTGGALAQPAIVELSGGLYYFDYTPAVTVVYKAALNGTEVADVLQPVSATGVVPPGPGSADLSTRFQAAGEIINRVASEVGLEELADPYTSQDPNFVQLRRLLQSAGSELLNLRPWPHLVKTYTLTTVNGQADYPLPADFRGMINETGWNDTRRNLLAGPASHAQWRRMVVWGGTNYTLTFQLTPHTISFYPTPAAGVQASFRYQSDQWVQSQGAAGPDKTTPSATTDKVLFDDLLAVRALKLKYLQAKGFDTTVAAGEYTAALEAAAGRAGGAPRLSLNRAPIAGVPFADGGNGILYH